MKKAAILASVLIAGAAYGTFESSALAAKAKGIHAGGRADCEHEATMLQYIGQERVHFVRRCIATGGPSTGKVVARRPSAHPSGPAPTRAGPLGATSPSTSTDSTTPSTAGTVPSTPVVGSGGTSISGSSANSASGSSGSILGSSSGRSTSGSGLGSGSFGGSSGGGSVGSSSTGSSSSSGGGM